MRLKTFAGILFALAVVVSVAYLSNQNETLLNSRFALNPVVSLPLYVVMIGVFLAGFLPAVSLLLLQSLKRDLQARRDRRSNRQVESTRASFRRAVDHRADGLWGKALSELEALEKEQPENFGTLLYYGEALRELGRVDQAINVHRRLTVLYPQGLAALYELAADYEAAEEPEVADQIYDRVLRDFPGQGLRVHRLRRDRAIEAKEWTLAGDEQEKVDALLAGSGAPGESEAEARDGLRYQSAVALLRSDRPREALEALRGLLERRPDFVPARILQGEVLQATGDDQGALAAWSAGFEESGRAVYLQRIEDHFIEAENPMLAIETLHGWIGSAQSDLLPRFYLGRLYYRLEMHDEAHRTLAAIADRVRSSPTYHYLIGRILERKGDAEGAIAAYRTSLLQAGMGEAEYICRSCGDRRVGWAASCDRCAAWNTLELDFEEETLSAEELGVHERPIYTVADEPV